MNTNSEYAYFIQEVFGDLSNLFNVDLQDVMEPCVIFLKDLHYNNHTKSLLKNPEEYIKNPFSSTLMQQLLNLQWVQSIDVDKEIKDLEYAISLDEKELTDYTIQKSNYTSLLKDKGIAPNDRQRYKEVLGTYIYKFDRLYSRIMLLKSKVANLKQGKGAEEKEKSMRSEVLSRNIFSPQYLSTATRTPRPLNNPQVIFDELDLETDEEIDF